MDPKHKTRRQFSKQFKAETIALIQSSGKSVSQVCRDLDLAESVVRRWLAQAQIDAGQRDGLTTAEHEEMLRQLGSLTLSATARHTIGASVAVPESFFATLKKELLYRAIWPTRQRARSATFLYLESFYNHRRRHSTLGFRSPADFEADHLAATLAA